MRVHPVLMGPAIPTVTVRDTPVTSRDAQLSRHAHSSSLHTDAGYDSRGVPFVIFLLMIAATVTWRTKVYFDGGLDPVVVGKGLLSFIALATAFVARRRVLKPYPMGTRSLWIIVAFLGISTFGGWTAGEFSSSAILAARVLVLAFAVALLVRTFSAERLIRSLLSAMLVVGLIGAVSGLGGVLDGALRLRGGLLPFHPNEIAMLCGVPALGMWWLIMQHRARPYHWVSIAGILGITWLTGSRTGLIALIIAMALMLVQARRLAPPVFLLTVAAIPALAYLVLGTSLIEDYFDRGGDANIATLSSRTIAWSAAFTFPDTEWIRWMGSGLVQKKIPVEGQYWDVQGLDSSWISALVQAGFLGMALFGIWALVALVSSSRATAMPRMLFVSIVVYLLIRSVLESGLLDATPAFITWFLISLLSERTTRVGIRATPPPGDELPPRSAARAGVSSTAGGRPGDAQAMTRSPQRPLATTGSALSR